MDLNLFKKILRYAIITISCCLALMIGVSFIVMEASKKPPEVRNRIMADLKNQIKIQETLPNPWPPRMNKPFPDFALIDQEGTPFRLSQYRGKVIIIEAIDMSNKASQTYSGARVLGPLATDGKAQGIDDTVFPISEVISKYSEGKVTLPHKDVIEIKILYYNQNGEHPKPEDAALWAKHFGLLKAKNVIVAVPELDMRALATASIIPGYQLIDRTFNLRVTSAGEKPKHGLEMTLIPLIAKLL